MFDLHLSFELQLWDELPDPESQVQLGEAPETLQHNLFIWSMSSMRHVRRPSMHFIEYQMLELLSQQPIPEVHQCGVAVYLYIRLSFGFGLVPVSRLFITWESRAVLSNDQTASLLSPIMLWDAHLVPGATKKHSLDLSNHCCYHLPAEAESEELKVSSRVNVTKDWLSQQPSPCGSHSCGIFYISHWNRTISSIDCDTFGS